MKSLKANKWADVVKVNHAIPGTFDSLRIVNGKLPIQDCVADLRELVNRSLKFDSMPKVPGMTTHELAIEFMKQGFQPYESLQELHVVPAGPKPRKPFDYSNPEWINYVYYSACYGSRPSLGATLLNDPFVKSKSVKNFYELMCGAADLSIYAAADFPDTSFWCSDIDMEALDYVGARADAFGLTNVRPYAFDILKKINKAPPNSMAFIGKESLNYFSPKQIDTILSSLINSMDITTLELLRPTRSFSDYFCEHKVDWLAPGHKLVERYTSNVEGRKPENAGIGQVSMALFHEVWRRGRMVDYGIVSHYDWIYYDVTYMIRTLLRLGLRENQIRFFDGQKSVALDEYQSDRHHKIFTGPNVITVMFGKW